MARPSDRPALLRIVGEWTPRYPLRVDAKRTSKALDDAVGMRSTHYCAVSHRDGEEPTGALIAMQFPNLWARKNCATILLWVARVPGDGAAMLRAFLRWVQDRPTIRVAGLTPDLDGVDDRAFRLAERIGFARRGGSYLYYKGT